MDIIVNNEELNKEVANNNELPSNTQFPNHDNSTNTKIPLVIRMIKKDDLNNSANPTNSVQTSSSTSSIIKPKIVVKPPVSSTIKLAKLPIKPSPTIINNPPTVVRGPIRPVLNKILPIKPMVEPIPHIGTEGTKKPELVIIPKKKGTICLEEGCGKRPHCNYDKQHVIVQNIN